MKLLQPNSTIIIASHNHGKISEIAQLLQAFSINVLSAKNFNLSEPEETGTNFSQNAALKARFVADQTGHIAISDDSGLAVLALNGAPGIFSARWAKTSKNNSTTRTDFLPAFKRIFQELKKVQDPNLQGNHRATFICALAYALPNADTKLFEGRVDGHLVYPPRGNNGFGYDPIFIPDGYQQTFGEMQPKLKHAISHRARAFAALLDYS